MKAVNWMRNIKIDDVKPGMILARTIINDNMMVVLSKGKLLTEAHITRMHFLGIKNIYVQDEFEQRQQAVQKFLSRSHAFVAEYQEVLTEVEDVFEQIAESKEVPVDKVKGIIDHTVTNMAMRSGVIDYLYEVKSMDNFTYNHSFRVSILAGVLAKWMRYNKQQIKDVILAGFLHDIGKTQIDKNIVMKNSDRLSGEERKIYERHTTEGYKLIAEKEDIPEGVKYAVLQHHECNDGTGFPLQKKGNEIHEYAKIIAVADFYDLYTSERESYKKQTPFSTLKIIGANMYTTMDPKVCIPFLLNVRQAFIGSEVLLSNEKKGLIVQFADAYDSLPLIKISDEEMIDLNREHTISIVEYNP